MFAVLKLNFKAYNFTIKKLNSKTLILDIIRKKFVALTPEEWVRQHVIHFFINELAFPKGLLSVEKALSFNGMMKRFDAVVFDNNAAISVLIECKSPNVLLNQSVLQQAGIYQKVLNPQYIFITNGLQHLIFKRNLDNNDFLQIEEMPAFTDLG